MMTTAQADDYCDKRFCSMLNWDQNAKGNWTRRFKGKLLTVFQRWMVGLVNQQWAGQGAVQPKAVHG